MMFQFNILEIPFKSLFFSKATVIHLYTTETRAKNLEVSKISLLSDDPPTPSFEFSQPSNDPIDTSVATETVIRCVSAYCRLLYSNLYHLFKNGPVPPNVDRFGQVETPRLAPWCADFETEKSQWISKMV